MKSTRLMPPHDARQVASEGLDYVQVVAGVALVVTLVLLSVWLHAAASGGMG